MARTETSDTGSSAAGSNANDWLSAPAHTLEAEVCLKVFKSDPKLGLDEAKIQEHAGIFGANELKKSPPPTFASILLRNALNGEFPHILWPRLDTSDKPHAGTSTPYLDFRGIQCT